MASLLKALESHLRDVDRYRRLLLFMNQVTTSLDRHDRRTLADASNGLVSFYRNLLQRGVETGEFAIDNVHLCAFNVVMIT